MEKVRLKSKLRWGKGFQEGVPFVLYHVSISVGLVGGAFHSWLLEALPLSSPPPRPSRSLGTDGSQSRSDLCYPYPEALLPHPTSIKSE